MLGFALLFVVPRFALAEELELAAPPRLAAGFAFGLPTGGGASPPNAGVQLRYRPILRAPVELEVALNPRWSSVSGGALAGSVGVLSRPVVFSNRKLWFGAELGGGVGYSSDAERAVEPYWRAGVAVGFAADWAPVVSVGFTQTPQAPPVPSVSLSWELGGKKRP